jgi:hypothetical protein
VNEDQEAEQRRKAAQQAANESDLALHGWRVLDHAQVVREKLVELPPLLVDHAGH